VRWVLKVVSGVSPVEGFDVGVVVVLKVEDSCGKVVQVVEVVRGQGFSLQNCTSMTTLPILPMTLPPP